MPKAASTGRRRWSRFASADEADAMSVVDEADAASLVRAAGQRTGGQGSRPGLGSFAGRVVSTVNASDSEPLSAW